MSSEITVVIPSYNPGKFLIKALQSVHEQTYSNWRLILVDDCSTDNSLKMAKNLLNSPKITVIKNPVNLGQSKAQNVALKSITTPYFVQLDSDDWFTKDALETLVNVFRRQPKEIAVVSGDISVVYKESNYIERYNMRFYNTVYKGRIFKDKYDFMLSNKSLWPRCYRTSAVRTIGGWPTDDPYEGRHMEDKSILYRLTEKYKFYWIDKVLYFHRRHDNNDTNNTKVYNEVFEWRVRRTLRRWGNQYRAVFKTTCDGWKYVDRLI